MARIGTGSHGWTPQARRRAAGATPPAMAAGITDHGGRVQALLASHVPPPPWSPPRNAGGPRRHTNAALSGGVGTTVRCRATDHRSHAKNYRGSDPKSVH